MRFILLSCVIVAVLPALFAAGRQDNGPIAFSLVEKCQQYFKCKVDPSCARWLHLLILFPAVSPPFDQLILTQDSDIAIAAFQAQQPGGAKPVAEIIPFEPSALADADVHRYLLDCI